ncbi:hypothetical protein AVEN_124239-1 [Araneus ventricosus]|uniref:Uncharacterized protein n=1 Tax=Araneus ventricosus TaxID=182803 RepID=A0A4Y2M1H5_ARAVE|nr:hypothetical protein AVEN_124239-1 [Araneus ventricosus]
MREITLALQIRYNEELQANSTDSAICRSPTTSPTKLGAHGPEVGGSKPWNPEYDGTNTRADCFQARLRGNGLQIRKRSSGLVDSETQQIQCPTER